MLTLGIWKLFLWYPHQSILRNRWKKGHIFEILNYQSFIILFNPNCYPLIVLQVGYIVTSCLLNENNDFLRMVINTVRNDIIGRNETYQCLALTMVCLLFYSFTLYLQFIWTP
jgi:hypothetical protein